MYGRDMLNLSDRNLRRALYKISKVTGIAVRVGNAVNFGFNPAGLADPIGLQILGTQWNGTDVYILGDTAGFFSRGIRFYVLDTSTGIVRIARPDAPPQD